jgi:hypothetical protein
MQTRLKLAAVALIIIIVVSVTAIFITNSFLNGNQPVYVGVTYCGDSVEDAKLLIDKVKDYTNLFILQSGSLQSNGTEIEEIGDYAVNSGLYYMVYLGISRVALYGSWPATYDGHWGNHFLGVYAIDEPAGKLLDGQATLIDPNSGFASLTKMADGTILNYQLSSGDGVTYMRNGTVRLDIGGEPEPFDYLFYYPNGTVFSANVTYENTGSITTYSPYSDTSNLKYTYDELWQAYPFQTPENIRQCFVNYTAGEVQSEHSHSNTYLNVVTADYGLYWYDYQSGYDAVLAQFCWNQSITQEIALVRGAANLYGKDWGAMITWKYTEAPYLPSGEDMYQDMVTAYRNGAKYIAVFNYADDMQGPYGILTEDHFQALQKFWTDIHSGTIKADVKADTAFVLPNDYGSGLRNEGDNNWGIWAANQTDRQIWHNLQNALSVHGEKLDVVYEDSAHPVTDKYSQFIYWNQTG